MATMAGVRKLARAIISYYPEAKIDLTDDFDAKLWVALLKDVDDKAILQAVAKHVRQGNKYPPNAAEICKLAMPETEEQRRPQRAEFERMKKYLMRLEADNGD
jgi:hypothetical protein